MACIGDTKKILAVGDSICRGSRNGYRGFVGDLGLPYINAGQNSAALSVGVNDVTDIPTLLTDVTDFDPDIIKNRTLIDTKEHLVWVDGV